MSDEEYIVRREVEVEEEEFEGNPGDEVVFDNEFRILVLSNTAAASMDGTGNGGENGEEGTISVNVEESDMDELLVRQVKTLNDINTFFDEFDSTVAEPNEGHLKYEVGSDGLCVVLVDSVALKDTVVSFVQKFINEHANNDEEGKDEDGNDDSGRSTKRRR